LFRCGNYPLGECSRSIGKTGLTMRTMLAKPGSAAARTRVSAITPRRPRLQPTSAMRNPAPSTRRTISRIYYHDRRRAIG
jgi:hypothetical protein